MTKKDYCLIASAISRARWNVSQCNQTPTESIDTLVVYLATMLKQDNPRFNEDKFKKACKI
jgi:hypothetical protein